MTNRLQIPARPARPTRYAIDVTGRPQLTLAEVESNDCLLRSVREQAGFIREMIEADGVATYAGRGYHRDFMPARDFALRVLVKQGEIRQDPNDTRRFLPA